MANEKYSVTPKRQSLKREEVLKETRVSAITSCDFSGIKTKKTITKESHRTNGTVFLVGAGPGDPDLLTIKALRCIQQADVVVYDRLVSAEILSLIPSDKDIFYVGKAKGAHSVPQNDTNALLVELARRGKDVCRLKGGDAFVFGRGGEEMQTLHQEDIQVEVIPGITAASGCTSYAGIPLTHRGLSQGCTLVTAHAEKDLSVNWKALAALDHTLVFYMGLSKLALISEELSQAGLPLTTPVAVIEKGCTADQRVFISDLATIKDAIKHEAVVSPSLIVVGKVVSLAKELDWFITQTTAHLDIDHIEKLSA
ncbi:uroporphyrinogen-III C-methyltransferase [Enterovibrio calviensis]|uniref:uroporphyrinogen-III C-methyltransferase n=1 Tax=Enterovibrio calviensis TaxID=91359 RepID=UPI000485CC14|nr:uroporphyrinogen-III C-methyltransferase [Enterovibrio calviensis]